MANIPSELFSQLEKEVFTFWPTAEHISGERRNISVLNYAESLVRANPVGRTNARRDEFREFFRRKVEALLGAEVAESVYHQLATNHSIATAQHYTPLSPNTLNPTLAMSLAYFGREELDRQNIIVLACSGISFNNHWYPRGHLFHSLVNEQIVEQQINFFGRSVDADPVVTAPAYTEENKKNMLKVLLHFRSERLIKKRELNKIQELFDEIYFTPQVLSQKLFVDQLTLTNFYAWKKLFNSYQGNVPNLIFFPQEKIAADLLRGYHLNADTILHRVLFDTTWHQLIYKHFDNIMCAFSVERRYGTFLFWATPKNTTNRIQLFAKDGVLVSGDQQIKIPLTPEAIAQALENEEITPSTMLTFLVLSMYYGFFLTGGLDQPTYLTQTKQAFISLLQELGLSEEVENCQKIVANDIVLTRPTLAFVDGPHDQRAIASVLDLLVHGNDLSWPAVMEATKNVTMGELLYRLYPELYRDYCKHENKNENLKQITERDVEIFTGVDKKIPPFAILNDK